MDTREWEGLSESEVSRCLALFFRSVLPASGDMSSVLNDDLDGCKW